MEEISGVEEALEELLKALEDSPELKEIRALEKELDLDPEIQGLRTKEQQLSEGLSKVQGTEKENEVLKALSQVRDRIGSDKRSERIRDLDRSLQRQLGELSKAFNDLPGADIYEIVGDQVRGEGKR